MYVELNCLEPNLTTEKIQKLLFQAIDYGYRGLSCHPLFIPLVKSFSPIGFNICAVIDFPYGNSAEEVRSHAIINAIRKGANVIDLVVNNKLLAENDFYKLYQSILPHFEECLRNDCVLRIHVDYRLYETEQIIQLGTMLHNMGVEFLITTTSNYIDDITDNLILCHDIWTKCEITPIINANFYTKQVWGQIQESSAFGVRVGEFTMLSGIIEKKVSH